MRRLRGDLRLLRGLHLGQVPFHRRDGPEEAYEQEYRAQQLAHVQRTAETHAAEGTAKGR